MGIGYANFETSECGGMGNRFETSECGRWGMGNLLSVGEWGIGLKLLSVGDGE